MATAPLTFFFGGASLQAQHRTAVTVPTTLQTEADEYTRYELLAPETASFKIHYEVAATPAGAKDYCPSIRTGSTASAEASYYSLTREPLLIALFTPAAAP